MTKEQDLMQRLAVSKKIMEKHGEIKRSDSRNSLPVVEDYPSVNATYNLPQEFLSETTTQKSYHDPTQPLEKERIMNSKLPDEIKRLMLEQPIVQPSSMGGNTVLSNEVIEGAARLMRKDLPINNTEKTNIQEPKTVNQSNPNFNINELKNMIRDVVRDTVKDVVREELKEAGMVVESTQNTNEVIQFKVGNHLFIGRVTKIKKIEQ